MADTGVGVVTTVAERTDRTPPQAGLTIAGQADVGRSPVRCASCSPQGLRIRCWQVGQDQCKPVRMPEPPPWMNLQQQGTGLQRLGAPGPLLERCIRRAVGRIDRDAAMRLCQCISDGLAPAVHRIRQAVREKPGVGKGGPAFRTDLPHHPDHRRAGPCRQIRQRIGWRRDPAATQAQSVRCQCALKRAARCVRRHGPEPAFARVLYAPTEDRRRWQ